MIPKDKKTKSSVIKIIVSLSVVLLIMIGIVTLIQKYNEQRAREAELERQEKIENTLKSLGEYNRTFGSEDWSTVEYSFLLEYIEMGFIDEYIGSYKASGYEGSKKEYAFEKIGRYLDNDYQWVIASLLFAYDYLEKEDLEYFNTENNITEAYLSEEFIDIIAGKGLNFNTYIINEKDREVLNNISIMLRLVEDGYITAEQIYNELDNFVRKGTSIHMLKTELLEQEVEYLEIANNIKDCFSGESAYFYELTTTGKLVFLYMIPRFFEQGTEEGEMWAYKLWFLLYEPTYEEIWEEMINDEIFADVIAY